MSNVVKAMNNHLKDRDLDSAQLAAQCGWPESKLTSILNGYQKLNAADYGTLCEVLKVPYDYFYKKSIGVANKR